MNDSRDRQPPRLRPQTQRNADAHVVHGVFRDIDAGANGGIVDHLGDRGAFLKIAPEQIAQVRRSHHPGDGAGHFEFVGFLT